MNLITLLKTADVKNVAAHFRPADMARSIKRNTAAERIMKLPEIDATEHAKTNIDSMQGAKC
jgi:N-acetyl-beta-hexosaminidase